MISTVIVFTFTARKLTIGFLSTSAKEESTMSETLNLGWREDSAPLEIIKYKIIIFSNAVSCFLPVPATA